MDRFSPVRTVGAMATGRKPFALYYLVMFVDIHTDASNNITMKETVITMNQIVITLNLTVIAVNELVITVNETVITVN